MVMKTDKLPCALVKCLTNFSVATVHRDRHLKEGDVLHMDLRMALILERERKIEVFAMDYCEGDEL